MSGFTGSGYPKTVPIELARRNQSDPETRKRINAGEMDHMDIHLSHMAQFVEYGFLGKMDVARSRWRQSLKTGRWCRALPSAITKTWIDCAERIILEVNSWQPMALEGMHDLYYAFLKLIGRDEFQL